VFKNISHFFYICLQRSIIQFRREIKNPYIVCLKNASVAEMVSSMLIYFCQNLKLMHKLFYTLFAVLCMFSTMHVSAQNTNSPKPKTIKFFKGNLPEFETMLLDNKKPGFILLYSTTQRESLAMNRMLDEKEIVKYVDSAGFQAMKIDVAEYPDIALQYGIENVPCVILIDNFRREHDRLYNYRSAKDFRIFLNQIFE
jgi:hypothetical protein